MTGRYTIARDVEVEEMEPLLDWKRRRPKQWWHNLHFKCNVVETAGTIMNKFTSCCLE